MVTSIILMKKFIDIRPKSYHCKDPEHLQSLPCWYRVYVDGYDGGESLGGTSYDVGGYLFLCP